MRRLEGGFEGKIAGIRESGQIKAERVAGELTIGGRGRHGTNIWRRSNAGHDWFDGATAGRGWKSCTFFEKAGGGAGGLES
jgi:hypothetical protein